MKIDVKHIAKLANLPLKETEIEKFEKQLEETAEFVGELNSVDTNSIDPTSQVTGLENVTRGDVAKPSLTQEAALSNAKSNQNGFFKVDAILNES